MSVPRLHRRVVSTTCVHLSSPREVSEVALKAASAHASERRLPSPIVTRMRKPLGFVVNYTDRFCVRAAAGSTNSGMESLLTQLAEPTPAFTEHQMQALATASQEYEKRDQEIASIVKVIHELSQIMRDLNTLVCEQGTMVDRIDQNVEAAAQQVERGLDEIRKAHATSKKSTMITIIMCLAVSVIVAFVLLIVMKA